MQSLVWQWVHCHCINSLSCSNVDLPFQPAVVVLQPACYCCVGGGALLHLLALVCASIGVVHLYILSLLWLFPFSLCSPVPLLCLLIESYLLVQADGLAGLGAPALTLAPRGRFAFMGLRVDMFVEITIWAHEVPAAAGVSVIASRPQWTELGCVLV